jgi:hypothetical protein
MSWAVTTLRLGKGAFPSVSKMAAHASFGVFLEAVFSLGDTAGLGLISRDQMA